MESTEAATLFLTEKLIAIALAYQALEYIQSRKKLSVVFIWPTWFHIVPYFLLANASLQLFFSHPLLVINSFAAFIFLMVSFRGTYNGGSDYMTALIMTALTITQFFPNNLTVVRACLLYISIQALLSYFIAGLVKLKNSSWRRGKTLSRLLSADYYSVAPRLKVLAGLPVACMILSWLMIAFEITFPFSLAKPVVCLLFLELGIFFHLGISYALGLNRFFFAWISSYPAIYYLCLTLQKT